MQVAVQAQKVSPPLADDEIASGMNWSREKQLRGFMEWSRTCRPIEGIDRVTLVTLRLFYAPRAFAANRFLGAENAAENAAALCGFNYKQIRGESRFWPARGHEHAGKPACSSRRTLFAIPLPFPVHVCFMEVCDSAARRRRKVHVRGGSDTDATILILDHRPEAMHSWMHSSLWEGVSKNDDISKLSSRISMQRKIAIPRLTFYNWLSASLLSDISRVWRRNVVSIISRL